MSDTAPVQAQLGAIRKPSGTISWAEHTEAWQGYRRFHPGSAAQQDAQRIAERGGFGHSELTQFLGREPRTFVPNV